MDLSRADWFTSSYTGDANNTCVEVATNLPAIVAVRDSTDPNGPALIFSCAAWKTFTNEIKNGAQ
ncbi:DUF397 domain-containing protein [Actinomadura chibensis]|uniref:DUF397 domain-containing protein n=1 Tax=Actinomadura chibensis TaxID=392828 RepID=A0A5D0NZ77_9ACTN|nr:DUF397 domain-containing protein [Actinomadura chibensis]